MPNFKLTRKLPWPAIIRYRRDSNVVWTGPAAAGLRTRDDLQVRGHRCVWTVLGSSWVSWSENIWQSQICFPAKVRRRWSGAWRTPWGAGSFKFKNCSESSSNRESDRSHITIMGKVSCELSLEIQKVRTWSWRGKGRTKGCMNLVI